MSEEIKKSDAKVEQKTISKAFIDQGALPHLRRAVRPIAIITIVMAMLTIFISYLWVLISVGGSLTEQKEAWDFVEKISGPLATGTQIAFIVTIFLGLAVAGLMIAHTAVAGAKTRKNHLKGEMPTNIFNGLLSIFLFALTILMIVNTFGENKLIWKYGDTLSYPGESFHLLLAWLGFLLAFVTYFSVFARTFNKKDYAKLDTNTKSQRVLAMSNGETAILLVLPILLVIVSGFLGELSYNPTEILPMVKNGVYYAGFYISQVAILALMTIAGKTLLQIGLVFLKANDGKRVVNCIVWGVVGVITLAFFIVYAIFFKYNVDTPKWFEQDGQKTCAIIALITWLIALGNGIFSMVKAKNFVKAAHA